MEQRRIKLTCNKDRNRLEAKQTASIDAWRSPLSLSRCTICPAILGPVRLAVNLSSEEVSNLVRNVPLFTSLEVSPFFALLLSLGPPPERRPAPRFERRVYGEAEADAP